MKISKMHARVKNGSVPYQRFITDPVAITPKKGTRNGNCNRTACQKPGAFWWNRGSHSWYCTDCALMLSRANAGDEFCKDEPLCKLDVEAMNEWTSGDEDRDEYEKEWANRVSERICAK